MSRGVLIARPPVSPACHELDHTSCATYAKGIIVKEIEGFNLDLLPHPLGFPSAKIWISSGGIWISFRL
jgi:hypothetical protein